MGKREIAFKTEAELCAAFIEWAKTKGLVAYAETEGWDILLVAPNGTQVGVQAKMTFNMKVLAQTVESSWEWRDEGPDYRAVLLPYRDGESILESLGVKLIYADGVSFGMGGKARPHQFNPDPCWPNRYDTWHYWNPVRRHKLPEYVPDVIAGDSGPVQLTNWKIAALKITAILELRGFVTKADFKQIGIDMRRWVGPNGWLIAGSVQGQFIKSDELTFHTQHQTVYPQIKADIAGEIAAGRI